MQIATTAYATRFFDANFGKAPANGAIDIEALDGAAKRLARDADNDANGLLRPEELEFFVRTSFDTHRDPATGVTYLRDTGEIDRKYAR